MLTTILLLLASSAPACTVTDGDTIRCGAERIRLLGIDAPERRRCPPRRQCAPGDPRRATASLAAAIRGRPLTLRRFGTDRYGRTLALVSAGGTDLSCWQLRTGNAVYRPKWDNRRSLAAICPAART